ncbi:molecular chaperone DjiA [Tropicimonas sp. IMCC34011]|uniref:molecular chaperone DjiA n=1 Tax=Tropicimonas sp. IMCC34011 TaxID=2248759 RepID=UPI000E25D62A|nr:molecular chaperone DjiA [Tropicimonas sp. IMCC34011]
MSIWTRITSALSALRNGEGLGALLDFGTPPERSVGFTIAVIALGAKMAKADGSVSRNEVAAFRKVFQIPEDELSNAARVFNLARTDVAGFEEYAGKIARMFPTGDPVLGDVMEGLFHVAVADGAYHRSEARFLERVAEIFGLPGSQFAAIRARFVGDAAPDPYAVLGVTPDMPLDQIRSAWRTQIKESHPDRMIARGVPQEAVRMAEARMVHLNAAWDQISRERA